MDFHAGMEPEGAGATGRRAGMELRHGLAVLSDHQHLAGGSHLIKPPLTPRSGFPGQR